jgi:hypothetical protein
LPPACRLEPQAFDRAEHIVVVAAISPERARRVAKNPALSRPVATERLI